MNFFSSRNLTCFVITVYLLISSLPTLAITCDKATSLPAVADAVKDIQKYIASRYAQDATALQHLEHNEFQELEWHLREIGDSKGAQFVNDQIVSTLLYGEIVSTETLGGGTTGAELVTFENGLQAVLKKEQLSGERAWATNVLHEVASYLVSAILKLDLVPTTVIRRMSDGTRGSLQIFIPEAQSAEMHNSQDLWAFSILVRDVDSTKSSNQLRSRSGRVIPIDQSLTFMIPTLSESQRNYPTRMSQKFRTAILNEISLDRLKQEVAPLLIESHRLALAHQGKLIRENGKIYAETWSTSAPTLSFTLFLERLRLIQQIANRP